MFLSSKTLLFLGSTLFFLHGVIARPVCPAGTSGNMIVHSDFKLQSPEPFEYPVLDRALSKHCVLDIDAAPVKLSNSLPEKAKATGEGDIYKRQQPPKISMERTARKELDNLNLHGKRRKKVIKWHKFQLKQIMKKDPKFQTVETTKIHHIAHEGGSNPNEPNHITASFETKYKTPVPSPFNGKKMHHVYVNSNYRGLNKEIKAVMVHNNNMIKQRAKTRTSALKTHNMINQRQKSKMSALTHNNMIKQRAKGNLSGARRHT